MIVLGYTGFTRDSHRTRGNRSTFARTNLDFDTIFTFRDGEIPFSLFPLGYLGHDASAAIIKDGVITACAAEERFTRAKHALNLAGNTLLPSHAINYCLKALDITINEVDMVAHYCDFGESTIARRLDLLRPYLSPGETAGAEESCRNVFETMMSHDAVYGQFERMTGARPEHFAFIPHHEAHAASAFFASGFDDALILTLDGTGELESSLLALGKGNTIREVRRTFLPASLGTLYLIITVFLGFKSLGDEYKVMGLAGYGNPSRFRDFFRGLVHLDKDGGYSIPDLAGGNLKEIITRNLGPARRPDQPVTGHHQDIAAALQETLRETVLHTLSYARSLTGSPNLCMAGGVALNCMLNGAIARSGLFERIFVQPAAGDEGCSLGAALYSYYCTGGNTRARGTGLDHVYLGPEYTESEIRAALDKEKLAWTYEENIARTIARELDRGKVAGWFQGRMEFGPRALGNRSILADPRDPGMKDRINAKVKKREEFRPFAPAVLEEEAGRYFDLRGLDRSPFMLFAVPVKQDVRRIIPAVTHVDGTARVQTVSRGTNGLFWELIDEFHRLTGVPVVLNTSFNVRNEPIVCTPGDAVRCFLSTDIDCMAVGRFFVEKL